MPITWVLISNSKFLISNKYPISNTQNSKRNKIPVPNSINGYCHEILLPHVRHFARSAMNEKSGISSNHRRRREHEKHREPTRTMDSPVFNRNTMTFAKLPKTNPKRNAKMSVTLLLVFVRLRTYIITE